MLSLSLVTLGLAAFGAYAKPTSHAVAGLEVYLSTPSNKVASASDIKIFATVKNTGDEDLKIFKPGTVLDHEYHTLSFNVTEDGKEVPFTGTAVPEDGLSEKYWIVIGAGKNVTVEHDALSGLYNFAASGPGTLTFDPVSTFEVIGRDATRFEIVKASSISITIGGDASKRELGLEKRVMSIDCKDGSKWSFIQFSRLEAESLASGAISYIQSHDGDDHLYKKYFGNNDRGKVAVNFDRIMKPGSGDPIQFCSDLQRRCADGRPADFAFGEEHNSIFFCNSFYKQPSLSSFCRSDNGITRGGITLRMLASILIPDVTVFSDMACTNTAGDHGPTMLTIAAYYECFATDVYKLTKC